MRVVLSIGGSVLAPDLEASRVSEYAAVINDLASDGYSLGVVAGGGPIAREYIRTARSLGANEIELDHIGIAVTRLNARLLLVGLGGLGTLAPPGTYEPARAAIRRGEIPVMGGVAPAQTTDAVSAALAEYVNADRLVYATSVPGVFSADPNTDREAERFEELSAAELVETIAALEMTAGSSAPVDVLAAKIIQRAEIETIVLDGTDPARVGRAIRTGEFEGTRIRRDEGGPRQQDLESFEG